MPIKSSSKIPRRIPSGEISPLDLTQDERRARMQQLQEISAKQRESTWKRISDATSDEAIFGPAVDKVRGLVRRYSPYGGRDLVVDYGKDTVLNPQEKAPPQKEPRTRRDRNEDNTTRDGGGGGGGGNGWDIPTIPLPDLSGLGGAARRLVSFILKYRPQMPSNPKIPRTRLPDLEITPPPPRMPKQPRAEKPILPINYGKNVNSIDPELIQPGLPVEESLDSIGYGRATATDLSARRLRKTRR